tara:strand:- start:297 stop:1163 length:867 start_codon:yes stop_codon:yes gene_type:complete
MARFDYKKWITEQKYGKPSPPTNDKLEPRGELNPRDPESAGGPMVACSTIYQNSTFETNGTPWSCQSDLDCCHRFSLCVNGSNFGDDVPRAIAGNYDPHRFYDRMCPSGCNSGDVMEATDGNIYIYEGNGMDMNPVAIYPLNIDYYAPASCTPPDGYECPGIGQQCQNTNCTPIDGITCFDNANDCQTQACSGYTTCQNCCCQKYGTLTEQDDGTGGTGKSPHDFYNTGDMMEPSRDMDDPGGVLPGCIGQHWSPDPLTIDPTTGICDCDHLTLPQAAIMSVPNTGQC